METETQEVNESKTETVDSTLKMEDDMFKDYDEMEIDIIGPDEEIYIEDVSEYVSFILSY